MSRVTQKDRVIEMLRAEGQVDNFWAFHNYILRLGAIIHDLREEGWDIDGKYGLGNNRKNFIYTLVEEPEPEQLSMRKHINI